MTFEQTGNVTIVGGDRPDFHFLMIPVIPEWALSGKTSGNATPVDVTGATTDAIVISLGTTDDDLIGDYQSISDLVFQLRNTDGTTIDTITNPGYMDTVLKFYRADDVSECTVANFIGKAIIDEYGYGGIVHSKEFAKKSNKKLFVRVSGHNFGATHLDLKVVVTYLTSAPL